MNKMKEGMMMKKKIVRTLLLCMGTVALLAACGEKTTESTTAAASTAQTAAESEGTTTAAETGVVKSGMAVITVIDASQNATETDDGVAQADSTLAALILDESGRIVDLDIDVAQTRVIFSNVGQLVTEIDASMPSKREIGDAYGMKAASGIGKEWYEQMEAFEEYAKGKTVEELTGMALNESGAPNEPDLISSVTMKVSDYLEAVEKAAANAEESGAGKDDTVGVGIITGIDNSKDFEAGEEGVAQIDSYYAMATLSPEGKLSSAVIDGSTTYISFNDIGEVTADLEEVQKTKLELGSDYGMAMASSISKDWDAQAKAIAEFMLGMSAAEVKAIAVTEDGKASDTDLISKATMSLEPFKAVMGKAMSNAQ